MLGVEVDIEGGFWRLKVVVCEGGYQGWHVGGRGGY